MICQQVKKAKQCLPSLSLSKFGSIYFLFYFFFTFYALAASKLDCKVQIIFFFIPLSENREESKSNFQLIEMVEYSISE